MSVEHPSPQWEFTQHFVGEESPDDTSYSIEAPAVAARGWIPLVLSADILPPGFFKQQWNESLATRELFRSGNDQPRSEFRGPGDFLQSLALKDFRSMLAIDEPKLYCTPTGSPRLFTCWRAHQPGFTPMRGGNATWHSSGDSTEYFHIHANQNEVTLDCWMRFRLSKLADLFGVALTRHSAPFASIRIILTMRSSGEAHVRILSSFIPSQHFYVGWKLANKYDMIDCEEEDFRSFITAGKRQNAPTADRFELELPTKRLSLPRLR